LEWLLKSRGAWFNRPDEDVRAYVVWIEIRFVFAYTATSNYAARKIACDLRFPKQLLVIHNHIGSSIRFAFLMDSFQAINNLGNH